MGIERLENNKDILMRPLATGIASQAMRLAAADSAESFDSFDRAAFCLGKGAFDYPVTAVARLFASPYAGFSRARANDQGIGVALGGGAVGAAVGVGTALRETLGSVVNLLEAPLLTYDGAMTAAAKALPKGIDRRQTDDGRVASGQSQTNLRAFVSRELHTPFNETFPVIGAIDPYAGNGGSFRSAASHAVRAPSTT